MDPEPQQKLPLSRGHETRSRPHHAARRPLPAARRSSRTQDDQGAGTPTIAPPPGTPDRGPPTAHHPLPTSAAIHRPSPPGSLNHNNRHPPRTPRGRVTRGPPTAAAVVVQAARPRMEPEPPKSPPSKGPHSSACRQSAIRRSQRSKPPGRPGNLNPSKSSPAPQGPETGPPTTPAAFVQPGRPGSLKLERGHAPNRIPRPGPPTAHRRSPRIQADQEAFTPKKAPNAGDPKPGPSHGPPPTTHHPTLTAHRRRHSSSQGHQGA
ncbi:proline-rich protein 2-like [Cynocephalus volans]|uniref:proline-rich protein 2-like n=1 Tax=Cynocephalus volans TaxID=110931 RepID=UPI002FC9D5C7